MAIFHAVMRQDQAESLEEFFSQFLPDQPHIEADTSWEIREVTVLRVRCGSKLFTVKAGANYAYPIERELRAHPTYTAPLTRLGRAPRLLYSDKKTHVVVLEYMPGVLCEGSTWEHSEEAFRQAGQLLHLFHSTESREDPGFERALRLRTLNRIMEIPEGAADLPADIKEKSRYYLEKFNPKTVHIVPTHGDYQPRNWLWDEASGHVNIIDFGRFGWRPANTDFARLETSHFADYPHLEAAFVEGYGSDPRCDPQDSHSVYSWWIQRLADGLGTYWYATTRGYNEEFAKIGLQMSYTALTHMEELA